MNVASVVNYDQLKQKLAHDMTKSAEENTKKYQNLRDSITHKPSLKARAELDQQKHIKSLLSNIGKSALQEFPNNPIYDNTAEKSSEYLMKIQNMDNIQIREMFNQERYVKI